MEAELRLEGSVDRVLFLRSIPILAGMSPYLLARFAEHARPRRIHRGESLAEPERPVQSLFIIVEGKARMELKGTVLELGPRDSFGALPLLAGTTGTSGRAVTDMLALDIPAHAIHDLLEDHFTMVVHVLTAVARLLIAEQRAIPGDAGFPPPAKGAPVAPERPLGFVERLLLLRRAFVFGHGTVEALAELAGHNEEVRLPSGQALWREGDPAEHTVVLASGTVVGTTKAGHRFSFGPGDLFGWTEPAAGMPRWYDATTDGNCVFLRVAHEDVLDVFEDHHDLAVAAIGAAARMALALMGRRGGGARVQDEVRSWKNG